MVRVAFVLGAALLALATCFIKPDRPPALGGGDGGLGDGGIILDAAGDGRGVDSPPQPLDANTTCATIPYDNFDSLGQPPCGSWGTALNVGFLARISPGVLRVAPSGMAFTPSGCETTLEFDFANGASIELVQHSATIMGGNSFFEVIVGTTTVGIQISGSPATINVMCTNPFMSPIQYNSTNHRWVKLAPSTNGGSNFVSASVSQDGMNWVALLTPCNVSPASIATAKVRFGTGTGSGTPPASLFDNFNIRTCPP